MCDRVIVLRGGCIVADGTLQQLQSLGFEAELGSGQGSQQMAELDDTAYDQGMTPTADPDSGRDSSTQVTVAGGHAEVAGTEQSEAIGGQGSEAGPEKASLPMQEDATGRSPLARDAKQVASHADTEIAQHMVTGKREPVQVAEQAAGHQVNGTEMTGEKGRVHIPSSVFGADDPARTGAEHADVPESLQRTRGPFGTLGSRFSRRTSRPQGSISGVPSMGLQMRTALSR